VTVRRRLTELLRHDRRHRRRLGRRLGRRAVLGILGTLVDELERRDLRYGLATLCVGGGMGIATIIERV